MRFIVRLVAAALLASVANAQDELTEVQPVEEEIRRYTVEVIIFSYEEEVSVGTEVFLPDEPPPENADLLIDLDQLERQPPDLVTAAMGDTAAAEARARKLELVVLPEEELTLDKIARQFALLDVYETIMHVGWTQPTLPPDDTRPLQLRVLGEPPAGLDGSFTLYLSRYLHLVVDLALDAPDDAAASSRADNPPFYSDDPAYSFGDSRPQYGDNFERHTQPVRYRIQENRIVKNGELRYFDHPKFGVLAKITRIEEEEDGEEPFDPLLSTTR